MKKSWIRLVCMILCVALMMGCMGSNALAIFAFKQDNIEWQFYEDAGVVNITGNGVIENLIKDSGYGAISEERWMKKVIIEEGISGIGDFAFFDSDFVESVEIPDSVTSIGNYAFYNCESLKDVTIPDSVTSIGNYAFYGCESLKSIALPESLKNIGECAFDGCGNPEITISPASMAGKGNSDAVHRWGNLTWTLDDSGTLTISGSGEMEHWDEAYDVSPDVWCSGVYRERIKKAVICEGVTSIGELCFDGCQSLRSFYIPQSLTNYVGGALANCPNLKTITISNNNSNFHVLSDNYGNSQL